MACRMFPEMPNPVSCSHCDKGSTACKMALRKYEQDDRSWLSLCLKAQGWTKSTRSKGWRCAQCTQARCCEQKPPAEKPWCWIDGQMCTPHFTIRDNTVGTWPVASGPSASICQSPADEEVSQSWARSSSVEAAGAWDVDPELPHFSEILTDKFVQMVALHARMAQKFGEEYRTALEQASRDLGICELAPAEHRGWSLA